MPNVVFMGTPDFAVPALHALIQAPDLTVTGVVTQPDRPAGRGQALRQSPVKVAGLAAGLPVFQPRSLKQAGALDHLREWAPDVLVVAAFGQILRKDALELAPWGSVNVHASILPRWRGAAPIQYAIRAGDKQTGITIMKMDEGLDTGPILSMRYLPLRPGETGASLHDRLAQLGGDLLVPTLLGYLCGEITPHPQLEEGVTLAPSLKKEEGRIDWDQTAVEIDRLVRAFTPWPGTFTTFDGGHLKIHAGMPLPDRSSSGAPGTLIAVDGGLGAVTGKGVYQITELQPAGKRRMSAEAFRAGRVDTIGQVLGG